MIRKLIPEINGENTNAQLIQLLVLIIAQLNTIDYINFHY